MYPDSSQSHIGSTLDRHTYWVDAGYDVIDNVNHIVAAHYTLHYMGTLVMHMSGTWFVVHGCNYIVMHMSCTWLQLHHDAHGLT